MSVNEQVISALESFGDPITYGEYIGSADRYYVFNYSSYGEVFADDEPGADIVLLQVHLYAPLTYNSVDRVAETKKALLDAGFTWPEMTVATDETGQHFVFECSLATGVDLDG